MTSQAYDENGEYINRLKLLHLAHNNPDDIYFRISNILDIVKMKDLPDIYQKGDYNHYGDCQG